ncbi:MAG: WecB/TagA/CpsF family glycosyltransferase [Muribaculaceae bacterium]|nr:WecB/TagA/CpsF family glycosyltransferase [Muribaculaceae bacterium]
MQKYFNINYEFDREKVHRSIDERLGRSGSDYICVADGVILNTANRNREYLDVVNGGMFAICDSSYVPLYVKWIYGTRYQQYSGSEIFIDVISRRRHRMIFLGTNNQILNGLRTQLLKVNPDVAGMQFVELPFCKVEDFDYKGIANMIEADGADIVWVALGAPKQEYFMSLLKPHLGHGVMIAVGAAFKFFSGTDTKRAPQWMVRHHLEFVHRLSQEPKKQFRRCFDIIRTLPVILYREWRVSKR